MSFGFTMSARSWTCGSVLVRGVGQEQRSRAFDPALARAAGGANRCALRHSCGRWAPGSLAVALSLRAIGAVAQLPSLGRRPAVDWRTTGDGATRCSETATPASMIAVPAKRFQVIGSDRTMALTAAGVVRASPRPPRRVPERSPARREPSGPTPCRSPRTSARTTRRSSQARRRCVRAPWSATR
jgi:hypothetical protein